MGYNTYFNGELKFKNWLTDDEKAYLKSMFGEDCREHAEWLPLIKNLFPDMPMYGGETSMTYIDVVFNDDETGIQWDDNTEKTYDLPEKLRLIIALMDEKFNNDFGLSGVLDAEGEESDDRWELHADGRRIWVETCSAVNDNELEQLRSYKEYVCDNHPAIHELAMESIKDGE